VPSHLLDGRLAPDVGRTEQLAGEHDDAVVAASSLLRRLV
jgi:hypothetical protein